MIEEEPAKISRHYIYAKHFPLYNDDTIGSTDCNQRYALLFGMGKERDEQRHVIKKMVKGMVPFVEFVGNKKSTNLHTIRINSLLHRSFPFIVICTEISKLYSKKFSMDISEGGKVKKQLRSEFNIEATMIRFQSMTYFEQHAVTWQCSANILELLANFSSGSYNYLPVQEHVAYLFDLMEACNNIYGLIETCIAIIKKLPQVESQLVQRNSIYVKVYSTTMCLYIVGVLRRYNRCLLCK